LQDTRTPALIITSVSIIGVAGCLVAGWLLPRQELVIGLPIAYALAYSFGLITAGLVLCHRLGRMDGHRLAATHARVLIAAAVAGCAAAGTVHTLAPLIGAGWAGSAVALVTAGLVGAAGYTVAARLLRLTELRQIAATTIAAIRAS
jgi:putative peptidoglycan lipid II flippase